MLSRARAIGGKVKVSPHLALSVPTVLLEHHLLMQRREALPELLWDVPIHFLVAGGELVRQVIVLLERRSALGSLCHRHCGPPAGICLVCVTILGDVNPAALPLTKTRLTKLIMGTETPVNTLVR